MSAKKIFSILLVSLFFGCKSINFQMVKKQLVTSGLPSGKIIIKYSTQFYSKTEFKLISVSLDKVDKEFKEFLVIELPKGTLRSSNNTLLPGSYYIELNVPGKLVPKESLDIFSIKALINEKVVEFKLETFLGKNILRK